MRRTVKEIAKEYGKGWEFRVFNNRGNYRYTATTDKILTATDEKFESVVKDFSESKIYIHLLYINLI